MLARRGKQERAQLKRIPVMRRWEGVKEVSTHESRSHEGAIRMLLKERGLDGIGRAGIYYISM
jgi:hypothetical protein